MEVENPYSILNVENGADMGTVKKAYRRLCIKYHPDNNSGNTEKFLLVQEAYKAIESGNMSYEHGRYIIHDKDIFNIVYRSNRSSAGSAKRIRHTDLFHFSL